MANSLYVTATEPHSGKSAVVLGLMQLLMRNVRKVAFFRPIIDASEQGGPDRDIELVLHQFKLEQAYDQCWGCTFKEARELINAQRQGELIEKILEKYRSLAEDYDFILCEGTDYMGRNASFEADLNADLASNLDCPLCLVASGTEKSADEICASTQTNLEMLANRDQEVACVIINRARLSDIEAQGCVACLGQKIPGTPVYVLREDDVLGKPSMADMQRALNAEVLYGAEGLGALVDDYITAAMTAGNFLDYITQGVLVITPGDRSDIVMAALASRASRAFPDIAGILITGGLPLSPNVVRMAAGFEGPPMPILFVQQHTYKTIMAVASVIANIRPSDTRKIDTALALFDRSVNGRELADRLIGRRSTRMTPVMFEFKLNELAKKNRMRIVLPEGAEERILRAADVLARREVADIILLGDAGEIGKKISMFGLDMDNVQILQPSKAPQFEEYVDTYFELRKAKGITIEQARDRMADNTYFGTMMVYKDHADGMVSGSINTTAHTIRPAFEFIKTKPGFANVSSVFLMCMRDRVLVFGDCAVIPNPTAEQLVEIAISSAETAKIFGIEPRVAMLSYSTGSSGKGADVDVVVEATRLAHERVPELMLEGPIQYDAAIDPDVAKTKLPDSEVAGRATVFVFPDLNTGNNTYKAVQRAAGVIAIGPVLQGLNKPVNDLSRGCTVPDIINTVTITAIQAQAMKGLL